MYAILPTAEWEGYIYIITNTWGCIGGTWLSACTSIYSLRHLRLTVWVCGIDIISGSSTVIPYCSVCNSDCIVIALPDTTGSGCRELSLSCVESSPFGLPSLTQQHLRKRLCIHSSIQQEYTGMSMRSLFWCFATERITDNPAPLTTKRTSGQQER